MRSLSKSSSGISVKSSPKFVRRENTDDKRLSTNLQDSMAQEEEEKKPPPNPALIKLPKDYKDWDTQKLSDWANECGLDDFAQSIINEDIDGEVLAVMTEKDLEELGLNMGHRKKILKSIQDNS